jgi:hypothetical protein
MLAVLMGWLLGDQGFNATVPDIVVLPVLWAGMDKAAAGCATYAAWTSLPKIVRQPETTSRFLTGTPNPFRIGLVNRYILSMMSVMLLDGITGMSVRNDGVWR